MCSRFEAPEVRALAQAYTPNMRVPFTQADFKDMIYPGYQAPVYVMGPKGVALESRFWGFVARFPGKRDPSKMIEKIMQNAVSETIEEKRTFSGAWKNGQRCLIPTKSFLEPVNKAFTPIVRPGKDLVVMAGIIGETTYKNEKRQAFTMLTCEPNAWMEKFHDRMPVILDEKDWDEWMSPDTPPDQALKLCTPYKGKLTFK